MLKETQSFGGHPRCDTQTPTAADAEPSKARRQSRKAKPKASPNGVLPSSGDRRLIVEVPVTKNPVRPIQVEVKIHSDNADTHRAAILIVSPMESLPLEDAAGQTDVGTQTVNAGGVTQICDELREQHRQRQDLHRAEKSLTLQIKSKCRRLTGGDKDAAGNLYDAMLGKGEHAMASIAMMANVPFLEARGTIETSRKLVEKRMLQLAKSLPVAPWVEATRGFGLPGLAAIIGECGDLSNYAGPAKVWKRMGLAVMPDGGRQRRVTGAAAIDHGYSAVRRSISWNIGACIVKSKGPLRTLYDERKAFEIDKAKAAGLEVRPAAKIPAKRATEFMSQGHVHNRAQRFVEKRVLRDLWRAWRDSAMS
jgi:hypothetical protein